MKKTKLTKDEIELKAVHIQEQLNKLDKGMNPVLESNQKKVDRLIASNLEGLSKSDKKAVLLELKKNYYRQLQEGRKKYENMSSDCSNCIHKNFNVEGKCKCMNSAAMIQLKKSKKLELASHMKRPFNPHDVTYCDGYEEQPTTLVITDTDATQEEVAEAMNVNVDDIKCVL